MTMHERFALPETAAPSALAPSRLTWLRSLGASIAKWVTTCADYYAAAAAYEDLSRLSNAELARRGLNRADLARFACNVHDKSA